MLRAAGHASLSLSLSWAVQPWDVLSVSRISADDD